MLSPAQAPTPSDLLARIDAAVARDEIGRAMDLARQVLHQGAETPLVLNLAAYQRELEGRPDEALPLLERALRLAPGDPLVHNALGRAHSKLGRPDLALPAFETAVRLAPGYSAAHTGRGLALEVLGRPDEAEQSLEAAIALDPVNPDALGALAALQVGRERSGAEAFAERALAIDPGQSAATLALATLEQRAGDPVAVERRLTPFVARPGQPPLHLAAAHRLLADAIDAQGERAAEAFDHYVQANRLLRSAHRHLFAADGTENGIALCDRLIDHFTALAAWPPAPGARQPPCRTHVFLVGFPRSGTTLLEQVLASHPDVVALEERPTIDDVGAWFASEADLARLADLSDEAADRLRGDYWARVADFGVEARDKVFIDKQPLDTLWLPYIAKLFPDARILFARRDPRDVVLSCFRRRFRMNGATYHFTDIVELARFYSGTMALAEVYRDKLGLPWRVHRHEDLVEDFDTEAKAVCDFLGLPWTEAMRDFAETAKRRDVRTPSAAQVRRGLYREGMGQWRTYAEGMAAALPILEPWVERYGYPAA